MADEAVQREKVVPGKKNRPWLEPEAKPWLKKDDKFKLTPDDDFARVIEGLSPETRAKIKARYGEPTPAAEPSTTSVSPTDESDVPSNLREGDTYVNKDLRTKRGNRFGDTIRKLFGMEQK